MQRMKSGLLILLLPPLALAGNQWDTMLPGGNMRFQGIVIAESCRVEAGDRQMTVKMGQISSNRFHSAGEDTNPVPFDIHLQECSTAVSQRVGVAFHGVADGKNPDVLSVGEGPGIATGIGVALFDKTGSQIPLNADSQGHGRSCTRGQRRCILSPNIVPPGIRSPEERQMLRHGSP